MDVLLISMPFGPVFWPSYALSLLKAELSAQGLSTRIDYYSIKFAELTGEAFYSDIADGERPLTCELAGEWIFSRALFGDEQPNADDYVEEILRQRAALPGRNWVKPVTPRLIEQILRARGRVEDFLEWCLERVVSQRPKLIGFTSIFQQHVASLALAKRLKAALPETTVVFGGANCEGVMGAETARQFPFVDAVVSGEADVVFPELVLRALEGRSFAALPGVRTPDGVEGEFATKQFTNGPITERLDELPYPDYDDYFDQFSASRFHREWQPGLFVETSRGCWWGERQHCTFCGLNGSIMRYRSKSAKRAIDEILHLTEKHQGCDVDFVDNILELGYFEDVLPELAKRHLDVSLFYETKANLRKEQIRLLRASGVRQIQPGIESLSDSVLKLMRKGVTALQNIQLLKWCKELGVEPCWSLLWGFPGEAPEEYSRMAERVTRLTHLPPPRGIGGLRLDRFSPNFFDAERLGLVDVTPLNPYHHIYPLPSEAVRNLAYFFSFRYRDRRDVASYVSPLLKRLQLWRKVGRHCVLFSVDVGSHLLVWDMRDGSREPLTVLTGTERALYQACDAVRDSRQLTLAAKENGFGRATREDIEERLERLVERDLMLRDGSRYLSLAIPLGDYSVPGRQAERFYDLVRRLGRRTHRETVVRLRPLEPGRPSEPRRVRAASGGRRPMRRRREHATLTKDHFRIEESGDLVVRSPAMS